MTSDKKPDTPDTPTTDTPDTSQKATKKPTKKPVKEPKQTTVQVTEEYILGTGAHTLTIDASNVEICNSRIPAMHLVTTVVGDKSEVTIYNLSQAMIILTQGQTIAQIK